MPLCTGPCSLPRILSVLPRARSPPPDDFMTDDIDSYLIAMETSELAGPSDALAPRSPSSNHTLTTQPSVAMRRLERGEEEEEEDTEDTERPPNKKVSFVVKGLAVTYTTAGINVKRTPLPLFLYSRSVPLALFRVSLSL